MCALLGPGGPRMQRCARFLALEGLERGKMGKSGPWKAQSAVLCAPPGPGAPRMQYSARFCALEEPECNAVRNSGPGRGQSLPGAKNCEILSGALVRKPPKIRVRPGHPGMHYCAHCWSLEGPERSNVAFLVPGGAQNAALWANLAPGGPRARCCARLLALERPEYSTAHGAAPWKGRSAVLCAVPGLGGAEACREQKIAKSYLER